MSAKRRLGLALWGVIVAAWIGDTVLLFITADLAAPGEIGPALQSIEDLAFVLAGTLGFVIVWRRPENAVGWWIMVAGLSFPLEGFLFELTEYLHGRLGATGMVLVLGWVLRWIWILSAINLPFTLLLYPDGRLPSARWRPVLWLTVLLSVALVALSALDPRPIEELGDLPNPVGIPALDGGVLMLAVVVLLQVVVPLLAVLALVVRFRRGDPVERQQVKVLLWVGAVVVVFFAGHAVVAQIPDWVNLAGNVFLAVFVSGAFALAILRYRLFDIDRLIRRTFSYALVAAIVAVVYGFGAIWLPTRLVGRQTPLFVASTTLVLAALFNPLRTRVMAAVDRRFHRAQYDASRIVEEFAASLRNEIDPAILEGELAAVVRRTMKPAFLSFWVRRPPNQRSGGSVGSPLQSRPSSGR